ncbi:MAG: hypothetical protein EOP00_16265 [Pedobacter sp.]|nr:MAG: hypothetical protein EOP00_16265 [Pedobacter sp.]
MKKILITIKLISFFFALTVNAQEAAIKYKPTPETKKFEGTWIYSYGNEKLLIKLKNQENFFLKDVNAFADVVQGSVLYIKNNKTIYQNENAIISGRTGAIMPYELWAIFKDPGGRSGKLILTFKDIKDTNTLTLKIIPRNHLDSSKYPPLKIPDSISLKRVVE